MMTKSRSAKMAGIKAIFALPLLFAVVLLFSAGTINPVSAQDKATKEQQEKATQQQQVNSKSAAGSDNQQAVYTKVTVPPEYPGGTDALVDFLVKNLKYPEKAKKDSIVGKVFVTFVVEADGSVSHVKVLRGIGGGCDEEAVRVVSMMPKWKPGTQGGENAKPVAVQMNLPIQFALNNKSGKK